MAVWHMGAQNPAGGAPGGAPSTLGPGRGPLAIEGNVKLGVELAGAERKASLRRGGDGRVAQFDGGYLRRGSRAGVPWPSPART